MNSGETSRFENLSVPRMQAINERCNAFENAWRTGTTPSLESFLEGFSGEDRIALAEQLFAIDLAYRRGANATLPLDDYARHIPEIPTETVKQWLRDHGDVDEIPLRIGDYEILRKIGQGGMGVVYLARQPAMDRLVALKVMRADLFRDEAARTRFRLEMKISGRLNHPNVVTAYDARDDGRYSYLAMEWIDGVDLQTLVRRDGPVPWRKALEMVRQAAVGLAYIHSQKLVHRDVKPSNLLLDSADVVHVADVGLARLHASTSFEESLSHASGVRTVHDATSQGKILGTVDCMAPEQAANSADADARSDIYSLGCTLHILLTGSPPFPGETIFERLLAHKEKPIPHLRSVRQDIPVPVERFVHQMLAKSPSDRPGTMEEVERALGDLLLDRSPTPTRKPVWGMGHAAILAAGFLVILSVVMAYALLVELSSDPTAPSRFSKSKTPKRPALVNTPFDGQMVQKEWADALGIPRSFQDRIGITMVLVPPGIFTMGSSPEDLEEFRRMESTPERLADLQHEIARTVTVDRPFYMSETEITTEQFAKFCREKEYLTHAERPKTKVWGWGLQDQVWIRREGFSWRNLGEQKRSDHHPAGNVCYLDAEAFCRWASEIEARSYRLPTEIEWEYACRAGTVTPWYSGSRADHLEDVAWFKANAGAVDGQFRPVAKRRANAFGLFDMLGNVAEWCKPSPAVPEAEAVNPVVRGGRFADEANLTRAGVRVTTDPLIPDGGIRVVVEVPSGGKTPR